MKNPLLTLVTIVILTTSGFTQVAIIQTVSNMESVIVIIKVRFTKQVICFM